jgi:hypothetical protein
MLAATAQAAPPVPLSAKNFARDLRQAIRFGDRTKVAATLRYPLEAVLPGPRGAKTLTVKDRTEFLQHYDELVNENVKRDVRLHEAPERSGDAFRLGNTVRFGAAGFETAYQVTALLPHRFAQHGVWNDTAAEKFFIDFQAAIRENKPEAVAAFMRFPFRAGVAAGAGPIVHVKNRADFLAHYASLFPEERRAALLTATVDDLAGTPGEPGLRMGTSGVIFEPNAGGDRFAITALRGAGIH